jgi:DNA-binding NarL/FixJ family response regulator
MNDLLKVYIVEDHAIFREGLKRVLEGISNIQVVGEAENGQIFLDALATSNPDIVLMDIKMPVCDGLQATEKALKINPQLKIIVLSMFGEEEYLYSMVLLGIQGFLLKTTTMGNLERAINNVANGHQYFSPELNGLLANRLRQMSTKELPQFTKKEVEVLRLLCKGLTTDEIADKMFISKRTVEGYRAKLLQKTGLTNTINLVIFAIRNKLVALDDLQNAEAKAD